MQSRHIQGSRFLGLRRTQQFWPGWLHHTSVFLASFLSLRRSWPPWPSRNGTLSARHLRPNRSDMLAHALVMIRRSQGARAQSLRDTDKDARKTHRGLSPTEPATTDPGDNRGQSHLRGVRHLTISRVCTFKPDRMAACIHGESTSTKAGTKKLSW
ncbi:hypothetical protein BCV70DRAFT_111867 [Testicularia cyperi]|uniref:Uncharacterized protein n=1 Tax=Testicularia cyperi TaxID=1882483 RepID=A0A317XPB0_9BASI|nr:hypothetical protein BCV70DRAFT_111867 [Testicularia cyperi]